MLTMADKGGPRGEGVGEMLTMADEKGRGVWTPQFLANIICEQPLIAVGVFYSTFFGLIGGGLC